MCGYCLHLVPLFELLTMLIMFLWSKAFQHNQFGNIMGIFPIIGPKQGVPLSRFSCFTHFVPLDTHTDAVIYWPPFYSRHVGNTLIHQKIIKDSAALFRVFTTCCSWPQPVLQHHNRKNRFDEDELCRCWLFSGECVLSHERDDPLLCSRTVQGQTEQVEGKI